MTTPTFDNIFTLYYTLYRAENTVPTSTDDEYAIALRFANEAIAHWADYDGTYWKNLYTTLQTSGGGTQVISTGTTTYLAPGDFREAGGFVRVKDANGNTVQSYPIKEPQEAQFLDDNSTYAYFTQGKLYYSTGTASQTTTTVTGSGTVFTSAMVGMKIEFVTGETATITAFGSTTSLTVSPSQTVASGTFRIINPGYSLHINPAPTSSTNGYDIDYIYYKKPTELTTGTSQTECSSAEYIAHRMLAMRYRASRNPFYQSALRDAENELRTMQLDNNSGTWANPWKLADNSGTSWGQPSSSGWGW